MTDAARKLPALLRAAEVLADRLDAAGDRGRPIGARLRASVVGPLQSVAQPLAGGDAAEADPAPGSQPAEFAAAEFPAEADGDLWELARAATILRCHHLEVPELAEAAAALQDLAVGLAEEAAAAARLAELAALQSGGNQQIQVLPDGPYLAANPSHLYDHLGVPIPARPLMTLCRCGESEIKPTCDGTCHRIGFTDAKDPDRVADQRDSYIGQQVTVLDNRGLCQQSGLCTGRLASVFHLGQEPFVSPSGRRMDEIIRAVRDCPSGALSYALDTVEARTQVDHAGQREPAIEVCLDGPYRITGGLPLVNGSGEDVARNEGASREHYALCRCGHSQNKPFCSGMHWYVGFHDPLPGPDRAPSMFEWAGGLPALIRMTRLFYEKHVPADPLLGPLFANMSADHPQRVAKWLEEVFGGPSCYSQEYGGYPRMISQHVGKCLTEDGRARWVALLMQSAQEAGCPTTRSSARRSAPTSSGDHGSPWRTPRPPPARRSTCRCRAGIGLPLRDRPAAGSLPWRRPPRTTSSRRCCPPPTNRSATTSTSSRCSGHGTGQSMTFAFDLWSYDDVRSHAGAILARLRNGTMPCDGAWPTEKIDVFARWVESGTTA
jgi:CDGSH-type Zn-finger protein/truncated hemoglobin YjbI